MKINIFIILSAVLIVFIYISNITTLRWNNDGIAKEVITITYTEDDIKKFLDKYKSKRIYYKDFALTFKVECMRFANSYYAILKLDNNKTAYAFFSSDYEMPIHEILIIDKFASDLLYESIVLGKTTDDELFEKLQYMCSWYVNDRVPCVSNTGIYYLTFMVNENGKRYVVNYDYVSDEEAEIDLSKANGRYILHKDKNIEW